MIIQNDSTHTLPMNTGILQKKLRYQFPLDNKEVVIYLDEFLPRILELSLKASDRKVRVNACEVLHTIVIYLIGQRKYSTMIINKNSPLVIQYLST